MWIMDAWIYLLSEILKNKQDMVAVIVYHVKDGKETAFELDYAPSQSAQKGRYIVFGNEKSGF